MTSDITSNATDSSIEPLWEFVPLRDYQTPGLPARSAISEAWGSLKHFDLFRGSAADHPMKLEADLRSLSEIKLSHLVPALNLAAAAEALPTVDKSSGTRFLIGQPFAEHAALLGHWAEHHEATLIEAPPFEALLANDKAWLDQFPGEGKVWVIPQLERWYLRHAQGLNLFRTLMDRLESGQLGIGFVGCDSWAWNYLSRVWPVPKPTALTLQAFDASRLSRLLASLVARRQGRAIQFRHASNGRAILMVPEADMPVDAEFVQLAAHCRGNVGVAVEYWRRRLRSEPEDDANIDEGEPPETEQESTDKQNDVHVWVADNAPEPVFPSSADEDAAILLHALLLHNGLPEPVLHELIPLTHHRVRSLLLRLRNEGLLKQTDDYWYLAPLSYARVRSLLRSRKFQTDNF